MYDGRTRPYRNVNKGKPAGLTTSTTGRWRCRPRRRRTPVLSLRAGGGERDGRTRELFGPHQDDAAAAAAAAGLLHRNARVCERVGRRGNSFLLPFVTFSTLFRPPPTVSSPGSYVDADLSDAFVSATVSSRRSSVVTSVLCSYCSPERISTDFSRRKEEHCTYLAAATTTRSFFYCRYYTQRSWSGRLIIIAFTTGGATPPPPSQYDHDESLESVSMRLREQRLRQNQLL